MAARSTNGRSAIGETSCLPRADLLSALRHGTTIDGHRDAASRSPAAAGSDTEEALAVRMQVAAMLVKQGNVTLAMSVYTQATERHPNDARAWQGLVSAYASDAISPAHWRLREPCRKTCTEPRRKTLAFSMRSPPPTRLTGGAMRPKVYSRDPGSRPHGRAHAIADDRQLQLADIFMRTARHDQASPAFRIVINADENSIDAWRGYLTALHKKGDDRTALAESGRIPATARAALGKEADFLTLLASVIRPRTSPIRRSRCSRKQGRFTDPRSASAADLELQLGWVTLASSRPDSMGIGHGGKSALRPDDESARGRR